MPKVTVELPEHPRLRRASPTVPPWTRAEGRRTPTTVATSRPRPRTGSGSSGSRRSVRAEAAGPAEIVVRVTAPRPDGGVEAADDRVFLTVGRDGARSRLGTEDRTEFGIAPATAASPAPTGKAGKAPAHRPVPDDRPAPAAQARAGAGQAELTTVCITGGWSYDDEKGVTRQAPNFPVRVFDVDSSSGNDLLAYGFTDGIGAFNLCYDNADTDEGGLVDPAVNFVTSNSRWRMPQHAVVEPRPTSSCRPPLAGPDRQHRPRQPEAGRRQRHRAVQAFDAVNQFWNWLPSSCWDANDAAADCRQIVINWTPTSTDGTYYSLPNNDVHLAAADPDSRHTVIHEATHAVMDDVYEDAYPDRTNCNPHRHREVQLARRAPGPRASPSGCPPRCCRTPTTASRTAASSRSRRPPGAPRTGTIGLARRGSRRRSDDRPRGHPERVGPGTGGRRVARPARSGRRS